jgi:hypothetical protein
VEKQASKNQKLRSTFKKKDKVEFHIPKVIFDGVCDHYYEERGLDPEGFMEAVCTKCPMGRRYDKKSYILVNGEICERK